MKLARPAARRLRISSIDIGGKIGAARADGKSSEPPILYAII